ncbi:hypothetical protein BGZ83_009294 [Gryganskiella cystojenkinii]|nr:hypothetical protein BGZ83_009294 [Gryganskiella cystojenkinii]
MTGNQGQTAVEPSSHTASTNVMNPIAHPLDLPEIRHILGCILEPHELSICARVNNDCKGSFESLLWKDITIHSRRLGRRGCEAPSVQETLNHKTYVQILTIKDIFLWYRSTTEKFWSEFEGFLRLQDLTFLGDDKYSSDFEPVWFVSLKSKFLDLTCLSFDPYLVLSGEMYAAILSGCPQLKIFRGGVCMAKDLVDDNVPWACVRLYEWVLCFDLGFLSDCNEPKFEETNIKGVGYPPSSKAAELQAKVKQKRVIREIFTRMSRLTLLETVDFSLRNLDDLATPLLIEEGSGFEMLMSQCSKLRELTFTAPFPRKAESWLEDHWPSVQIYEFDPPQESEQ